MARVKNWKKFQHYKDRNPPWIKLQKELLDDYDFACLPLASKALAPLLWLLASCTTDGEVTTDPTLLAFRLRWSEADIIAGLTPLIEKGFLLVDSAALAPCARGAVPEAEAEAEAEEEEEKTPSPPAAAQQTKVFDFKADLFRRWKELPDGGGGAFLAMLFRDYPEQRVLEAVERTLDFAPADPKSFVRALLKEEPKSKLRTPLDDDSYLVALAKQDFSDCLGWTPNGFVEPEQTGPIQRFRDESL